MMDNPETHKRLKIHNVQSEAVNQKKGRQCNDQKTKGQTMIYKTLQRKLKIEQHEPY